MTRKDSNHDNTETSTLLTPLSSQGHSEPFFLLLRKSRRKAKDAS